MDINANLLTGLYPTGQQPLDAKRYYLTLAELADLGASDFKAFYYYDRLKVLVLEDDKEYIWREEATLNETGGVVGTSFTYPANTINNHIDYSGKIFNFFPATSSDTPAIPIIESFGAVWSGVGFTFNCYADPYIILNQVYSALPNSVTLGAAPGTVGDKRKDAIVADVNGVFVIVPGVESPNPEDPDIDEQTQRLITIVLVQQGQTTPTDIFEVSVYDENAGEPNEFTATDDGGGTYDLASTNSPSKNSIHIEGLVVLDQTSLFFKDDLINTFIGLSSLSFDLYTPNQGVQVFIFFKLAGIATSAFFIMSPGEFGYVGADANYQTIGIPMGNFNFDGETFDEIQLGIVGHGVSNVDLVRFDNIRLTYGGDPFSDSLNTYLGLFDTDDTDYFGKTNYAGLVNENQTGLLLQPIVRFQDLYTGNAIIRGGVDFVVDLTRSVWSTLFIIDQVLHTENVRGNVTHDAADANPRWDIYYLEKLTPTTPATVGIKKGTAGVAPEKPGLDNPIKQVKVGEKLFISSEPVAPPEITSDLIYDELAGEPTEWTVTIPSGGVGNAVFGSGAFNGAVHIGFGSTISPELPSTWLFDNDVNIPWDPNNGNLVFGLRYVTLLTQFSRVSITFINSGLGILSLPFSMNRNQLEGYGFENVITPPGSSSDQLWYQLSIPTSDFTFNAPDFDRIAITFSESTKGSLDYIRYNTGVTAGPTETNITDISIQNENQIEQFRVQNKMLFEGVTFDPILKKITVIAASGFEALDEGNGIAWRLIGRDPLNSGPLGLDALDAGRRYSPSSVFGPTGDFSRDFGEDSIISGYGAFGNGWMLQLTNTYTHGIGWINASDGYASLIGGAYNTEINGTIGQNLIYGNGNLPDNLRACLIVGIALTGIANVGTAIMGCANLNTGVAATPGSNPLAPMITIGNGTHTTPPAAPWAALVRSNLLVGLRNGQLLVPSTTVSIIDAAGVDEILITKGWANSKFVTNTVAIATGSVLLINNVLGTLYNHDPGDTKNFTSYSIGAGTIAGGRAMARINAPSQPTVSGAGLEQGFPFIVNTDMYLNVWSPDGVILKYFFTPATPVSSVNRQEEYILNADKTLVASDEGKLFMIDLPTTGRNFKVDNELPQNGEIEFLNVGAFTFTFIVGTGAPAVLNVPDGTVLIPGAACTLIRRGTTNQYWLKGELQ